MQYLVSVIDDRTGTATPTEMAAIDAFNDRLQAEGHWVFAGLGSPSTATVIDNRNGDAVFADGPFLSRRSTSPSSGSSRPRDLDAALKLAARARRPAIGRSRCGRSCSLVDVREAITTAHDEEWARVVAALTRRFR